MGSSWFDKCLFVSILSLSLICNQLKQERSKRQKEVKDDMDQKQKIVLKFFQDHPSYWFYKLTHYFGCVSSEYNTQYDVLKHMTAKDEVAAIWFFAARFASEEGDRFCGSIHLGFRRTRTTVWRRTRKAGTRVRNETEEVTHTQAVEPLLSHNNPHYFVRVCVWSEPRHNHIRNTDEMELHKDQLGYPLVFLIYFRD